MDGLDLKRPAKDFILGQMGGIKGCKLISRKVLAGQGLTFRLFCSGKILEDPKDSL